jgi:hypothetical protein
MKAKLMRHSNSVQSRQQTFDWWSLKESESYIRRAIPLTMVCMFKKVV